MKYSKLLFFHIKSSKQATGEKNNQFRLEESNMNCWKFENFIFVISMYLIVMSEDFKNFYDNNFKKDFAIKKMNLNG